MLHQDYIKIAEPSFNLEQKLEQAKQALLTEQGNVKTNPRVVVELLEKIMVLQAACEQSSYSTAEALRHFQGKLDKQKWDEELKPPNIAGYLFGQVWATLAHSAITIGLLIVVYAPADRYCQSRESSFCIGVQGIKTYVTGNK